jgi:hypothetical protein
VSAFLWTVMAVTGILWWACLALAVLVTLACAVIGRLPRKVPLAVVRVPCPCCTGRPMESDDCNCGEDCGAAWCQAADPECPWCHTRECLDSTLCNCAAPCGSWLCVVKEASRG